jgi:hypothetical protein
VDATIRAALRTYDGHDTDTDTEVLAATMPGFVAMVRDHVPITGPRPPGPPRWTVDVGE